jgi:hypothetical protein
MKGAPKVRTFLLEKGPVVRRYILLTVVVGVPVIFLRTGQDPFNVPKLALMTAGVALAGTLRLAEALQGRSLEGRDLIKGNSGNDFLLGGRGGDVIRGGQDDVIAAAAVRDGTPSRDASCNDSRENEKQAGGRPRAGPLFRCYSGIRPAFVSRAPRALDLGGRPAQTVGPSQRSGDLLAPSTRESPFGPLLRLPAPVPPSEIC